MSNTTSLLKPRHIALHPAKLGPPLSRLPDIDRKHLRAIVGALGLAGDTQAVHAEAVNGVGKLSLAGPQADQPSGGGLSQWLPCVAVAVTSGRDALVHRTDVERLRHWLLLASRPIWLGSVRLVQLRAKAGDAAPDDPRCAARSGRAHHRALTPLAALRHQQEPSP